VTTRDAAVRLGPLLAAVLVASLSVPVAAAATEPRPAPACSHATNLSPSGTRVPSTGGSIWGLALGAVPPAVGDELKIVWRVTGRGPLRVTFTDPAGARRPLVFGPELHTASTFEHPGQEWGTGFRFDRGGCFTIRLARIGTHATVRLTAT
jgi:hypothetical protein